jgi:hypothetical protein
MRQPLLRVGRWRLGVWAGVVMSFSCCILGWFDWAGARRVWGAMMQGAVVTSTGLEAHAGSALELVASFRSRGSCTAFITAVVYEQTS